MAEEVVVAHPSNEGRRSKNALQDQRRFLLFKVVVFDHFKSCYDFKENKKTSRT